MRMRCDLFIRKKDFTTQMKTCSHKKYVTSTRRLTLRQDGYRAINVPLIFHFYRKCPCVAKLRSASITLDTNTYISELDLNCCSQKSLLKWQLGDVFLCDISTRKCLRIILMHLSIIVSVHSGSGASVTKYFLVHLLTCVGVVGALASWSICSASKPLLSKSLNEILCNLKRSCTICGTFYWEKKGKNK